jgi:methionyl aminopeptidase
VVNPPKSAAASGLLQGMLDGQGEDGDDDDDDEKTGVDVKTTDGKLISFVWNAHVNRRRR